MMEPQNQDIIDYAKEKYPEILRYSSTLGHMVDRNFDRRAICIESMVHERLQSDNFFKWATAVGWSYVPSYSRWVQKYDSDFHNLKTSDELRSIYKSKNK